ncbi:MAG: YHS domain-containing protein [Deltaproteobacteria bacterium]|nr:YHS domain-containing protein [Deltaproteobacteria bacterium]
MAIIFPENSIAKKLLFGWLLLGLLLVATRAQAVPPINHAPGVTVKGYDVVAYFTEGKPVKGTKEFQSDWMGAKWYFASAGNRAMFESDPEKYAAQYGGYCAYAVSQGITADIDPTAWKIVDGKLYLNLSPGVASIWERDIPGYIMKANKNWPKLKDK